MRRVRSSLLVLLTVAVPSVAGAADFSYGRGPTVISERPPVEEEIGTGWYLRGDIGYSKAAAPSLTMDDTRFSGIARNGSFVVGGGFGYKFNDWFRADLTVDQIGAPGLKRDLSGTVTCFTTDTCTVANNGIGGSVVPIMANGYVDFGKWAGFSPYVGGGVGVARLRNGGSFTYADSAGTTVLTTTVDNHSRWSPAFAAMAGLGIDLGAGLHLDAGYRYLWLSDGKSGALTQVGNIGSVPSTVEYKNNAFHQVRVGLRYFVN